MDAQKVARGLGWFSIGLGLAELIMGAKLSKSLGMGTYGHSDTIVRMYGLREIAVGVWILAQPDNPAPLWARVAGDVVDMGTLWSGLAQPSNSRRGNVAMAMGAVAGVTALDLMAAKQLDHAA